MAKATSAEKAHRRSKVQQERNKAVRSYTKTMLGKATEAIKEHGAAPETQGALRAAERALDLAAKKGVVHANAAARRKSRLAKSLNKARAGAPPKPRSAK